MMNWKLILLLCLVLRADAATRFTVVHELSGVPLAPPRTTGTVVIDGDSYRIDYLRSTTISTDAGKTRTALDAELRTYYTLKERESVGILQMLPIGKLAVALKSVTVTEEPTGEVIAGLRTRKYVLRLEYLTRTDVGSEVFPTTFTATGEIWTTDAIDIAVDPFGLRGLRTGYDVVDAKLREALSVVKGFPLMRRLAVSRKIANGRAQTELHTVTLSGFESIAVPPRTFSVPPGYKYQEPVIGIPGMD